MVPDAAMHAGRAEMSPLAGIWRNEGVEIGQMDMGQAEQDHQRR